MTTRMRRVLAAMTLALGAALFGGAITVLGKPADVAGTRHDVAIQGASPCTSCHIPSDPEGEALWAGAPNKTGPLAGNMKALCFSCHDGTVTAVGSYAFDPSRPEHVGDPGIKGESCDRCHDPHRPGPGKFLKQQGAAGMCQECHRRAGPADHPVNVSASAAGITPADKDWDATHGDFTGTRLWNAEGTGPGDYVKCLTCHSPHGGQPGTAMSTVAFSGSHTSFLPLCANCHSRWAATTKEAPR